MIYKFQYDNDTYGKISSAKADIYLWEKVTLACADKIWRPVSFGIERESSTYVKYPNSIKILNYFAMKILFFNFIFLFFLTLLKEL